MNTANTIYVVLCLSAWLICTIALLRWAKSELKAGRELPTSFWWLKLVANTDIVQNRFYVKEGTVSFKTIYDDMCVQFVCITAFVLALTGAVALYANFAPS